MIHMRRRRTAKDIVDDAVDKKDRKRARVCKPDKTIEQLSKEIRDEVEHKRTCILAPKLARRETSLRSLKKRIDKIKECLL
jgi:hypothetical protein